MYHVCIYVFGIYLFLIAANFLVVVVLIVYRKCTTKNDDGYDDGDEGEENGNYFIASNEAHQI